MAFVRRTAEAPVTRAYAAWMNQYYGTLNGAADATYSPEDHDDMVAALKDYFTPNAMVDLAALDDPRAERSGTPRVPAEEYAKGLAIQYPTERPDFEFLLGGVEVFFEDGEQRARVVGEHCAKKRCRSVAYLINVYSYTNDRIRAKIVSLSAAEPVPPTEIPAVTDPTFVPSTIENSETASEPARSTYPAASAPDSRQVMYEWQQVGNDLKDNGTDPTDFVVALSEHGLVVGTPNSRKSAGQVSVYRWEDSRWRKFGPTFKGKNRGEFLGENLALYENRLAIGSKPTEQGDGATGNIQVYESNGKRWRPLGGAIAGIGSTKQDGQHLALDKDRLAVGSVFRANSDGSSPNRVDVFQLENDRWQQLGYSLQGEKDTERYGHAVAINQDFLVVGVPGHSDSRYYSGQTGTYEWLEGRWYEADAPITGTAAKGLSGWSVSLSGHRLAVGEKSADANGAETGRVRVYEWIGDQWQQLGTDINGDRAGERWGSCVSLDGNFLAVGGGYDDGRKTSLAPVRVYVFRNGDWHQIGQDLHGSTRSNWFGHRLSLHGELLAVGASGKESNGDDAGYVRVYQLTPIYATTNE